MNTENKQTFIPITPDLLDGTKNARGKEVVLSTGQVLQRIQFADFVKELGLEENSFEFKAITPASPAPTKTGLYFPLSAGKYPNFGNIEITEEQFDKSFIFIVFDGYNYQLIIKSVDFIPTGNITLGETNAVNGDIIFKYIKNNTICLFNNEYLRDIGYNIYAIVLDNNWLYVSLKNNNKSPLSDESSWTKMSLNTLGSVVINANRSVSGHGVYDFVKKNSLGNFDSSYSEQVGYNLYSIVQYQNQLYISIKNQNKDLPTKIDSWEVLKITATGKVNINERGSVSGKDILNYIQNKALVDWNEQYASDRGYDKFAIVMYKNKIYISLKNENHAFPIIPDNWELIKFDVDGMIVLDGTKAVNGHTILNYIQNNSFVTFNEDYSKDRGYGLYSVVFYRSNLYISLKNENKDLPTLKTSWEVIGIKNTIITNSKSGEIPFPNKLFRVNFLTTDALPSDKTTTARGTYILTDRNGIYFEKQGTLKAQGSSSLAFPKKNWTFKFFNDNEMTDEFKLRIGKWVYHSEFVFKSNYIDATHSRNNVSNKIWEDMVNSRKGYPKRENEKAFSENMTMLERFSSGALCHVDGFPCELFVNNVFYGIGSFNLGKKRENYDLIENNQSHIQMAAETQIDFENYVPEQWEIRNPKEPDMYFVAKIQAWFDANKLTGQSFKDRYNINHDLENSIDLFLLAEFVQAEDMWNKNWILTSWNERKFYFLPYDLDTTFGLQWDGKAITGHTKTIRSISFWDKFYLAFENEIKARYNELTELNILTIDNVYKHCEDFNKVFGVDKYQQDFNAWQGIPSNSIIKTSFPQIYDWTKKRIEWMDSRYL